MTSSADAHRAVGHVEHGEVDQRKIQHIPHIAQNHPVDQVAGRARNQQRQADPGQTAKLPALFRKKRQHERADDHRYDDKKRSAAGKHAPGRAGIVYVGKFKHALPERIGRAERQKALGQIFCELIPDQDQHDQTGFQQGLFPFQGVFFCKYTIDTPIQATVSAPNSSG